jgi:3-oxoacyl-[acyl-carrier-protein] synthase II
VPKSTDPTQRVVVTGMGCVTPLGGDLPSTWSGVASGSSGCGPLTLFDADGYSVYAAGEVKAELEIRDLAPKERRRMDRGVVFALAASCEAIEDSKLEISDENRDRISVAIGSGIGGLGTILENHKTLLKRGPRKVSPFTIPMGIANMPAGCVSIHFGLRGPGMAHVSACASGAHAIGESARSIVCGEVDVAVTGGVEAPILDLPVAGFASMRALTPFDGDPALASRPFDRARNGFVIAEGAGIMVLESLAHAQARGAHIHAELLGHGATTDAHHVAVPAESGDGPTRCMEIALAAAGLSPEEVDYVNAHATSTPAGDPIEIAALRRVFGEHMARLPISSTKSMIGHQLGAAGAVEAILCVRAIQEDLLPPTINLDDLDPACDADHVANKARPAHTRVALSNSFGFGGTNATLILGECAP